MTPREVGQLLARIATYNRRHTDPIDVLAWHEVLEDIELDEALAAVVAYFRTSDEWVMPSDIRDHVREQRRRARRRRSDVLGLPSCFEANDVEARLARRERGRRLLREAAPTVFNRPRARAADTPSTAMDTLRRLTDGPRWPDAGDRPQDQPRTTSEGAS